jgi:hypothetical protein
MTRHRLLAELDSAELTGWQAFFQARQERDADAAAAAAFERRITGGAHGDDPGV